MAPTAPKSRSILKRSSSSTLPDARSGRGGIPHKSTLSAFANTKKDKRIIKKSSFLSRITKSQKAPLKRRRPSKKLVTTLESLGDVLDDIVADTAEGGDGKEQKGGLKKSLKSRPGATKRREKVERMERERFGKNMALMVGGTAAPVEAAVQKMAVGPEVPAANANTNATSGRWAALRGFIEQTIEQKKEFQKS